MVIVLAIAAVAGTWYYMNKKINDQKAQQQQQIDALNKQLQDLQKQSQSSTTPTESQKSTTTQYEKISFQYPSTWVLTDTSKPAANGYPYNTDVIKLTNGSYVVDIQTGVSQVGGACPYCKVLKTEPITLLGQNLNLNYVSNDGGPKVDRVIVAKTPTDTFGGFAGKTMPNTAIFIYGAYKSGDNYISKTLTELQSDTNLASFKQTLQSMKY